MPGNQSTITGFYPVSKRRCCVRKSHKEKPLNTPDPVARFIECCISETSTWCTCVLCGYCDNSRENVQIHVHQHLKEVNNIANVPLLAIFPSTPCGDFIPRHQAQADPSKLFFKCRICRYMTNNQARAEEHVLNEHVYGSGEGNQKAPPCKAVHKASGSGSGKRENKELYFREEGERWPTCRPEYKGRTKHTHSPHPAIAEKVVNPLSEIDYPWTNPTEEVGINVMEVEQFMIGQSPQDGGASDNEDRDLFDPDSFFADHVEED